MRIILKDSEGCLLGFDLSEDGDVTIFDGAEPLTGKRWRFCTRIGGGTTPRTLEGLKITMMAAKKDIEDSFLNGTVFDDADNEVFRGDE